MFFLSNDINIMSLFISYMSSVFSKIELLKLPRESTSSPKVTGLIYRPAYTENHEFLYCGATVPKTMGF